MQWTDGDAMEMDADGFAKEITDPLGWRFRVSNLKLSVWNLFSVSWKPNSIVILIRKIFRNLKEVASGVQSCQRYPKLPV